MEPLIMKPGTVYIPPVRMDGDNDDLDGPSL